MEDLVDAQQHGADIQGLQQRLGEMMDGYDPEQNVSEGDCIAFVLPNSVAFAVSFYALADLRAVEALTTYLRHDA